MGLELINELIVNPEKYYAHIDENKEKIITRKETLRAHTALSMKYFKQLWKEKEMDVIFDNFCKVLIGEDATDVIKNALRDMIFSVPIFHDFGKINPAFQNRKMKNKGISDNGEISGIISSNHSILSAVLYIQYYIDKIKLFTKNKSEKNVLRAFVFLNAYIISRHHSDLCAFSEFLTSLEEKEGYELIKVIVDGKFPEYKGQCKILINAYMENCRDFMKTADKEKNVALYTYEKTIYSLLVASDYYATTEFMSGKEVNHCGDLNEIDKWIDIYEKTDRMSSIRSYEKTKYPKPNKDLILEKDINVLRSELFIDAEKMLKRNPDQTMFYLEAPTGSGKSNTAVNLSFQLMKQDQRLKKIYYIYPFNTLVEQNIKSLEDVFGNYPGIMEEIAVINSLTPIKMRKENRDKDDEYADYQDYQKALLDRQFLNYPMLVSTHVSLFDTMFGDSRESVFGFHQLINSVIVLDEIQSYKNLIWGEIIHFLKVFSNLLNIRIIIMSATLPDFDMLTKNIYKTTSLINNRDKYFLNARFKNRVEISYELLKADIAEEDILQHICCSAKSGKKVLVELIKKKTARRFFDKLTDYLKGICRVEYMSGDDSIAERSRILNLIKKESSPMVLVATQVVEAGVDIDMDIGYKNISKLDSEEQFLGRINRSALREGKAFFFKLDEAKSVYNDGDVRIHKEFTLEDSEIQNLLVDKDFHNYYEKIMEVLKHNRIDNKSYIGLDDFFETSVAKLDFEKIKDRLKLINEDKWSMSVYLARIIDDEKGEKLDGEKIWGEYKELLNDFSMPYAEKRIKLSEVKSKMNNFIYQIKKNSNFVYDDKIGEIYYIENGEKYFENKKLNRERLQGEVGDFVDFI